MIAYILVSYVFMFCVFISDTIKEGEIIGFKKFLFAPLWFPLVLLCLLVKLINWSAR